MKKTQFLLSAITGVGITIGMLGCSGDGVNPPLEQQTVDVPVRMAATYSPATGSIPLPNDLLFGGSTDLTLNIPVADATDFSDPSVAISALDGWSATAPFAMSFSSLDPNVSVDAASVVGGSTVRVFKVNVLRPEVSPGIIAPTGPVTSVERELTANLEFVVQATGPTSVAIIPTVPFEQQASYMVVVTNGLMDSNGLPILTDSQYAIAKSVNPIAETSSVAALEPVRQLVNAMENAAAAFEGGPARNSIIMSYQFTVQSVGTVMQTAKAAHIDRIIGLGMAGAPGGALPNTSFTNLGTDTTPFTGLPASTANLYKGTIELNYMLGIPDASNPTAPLDTFWVTSELVPNPADPLGPLVPNPAPLSNLSYANPLPQINGTETVPLLLSIPKAEVCEKPENGYPITIFQHGITANRTNLIAVADSLGQACIAAVAMDMPLHGIAADNPTGLFEGYEADGVRERTFGIDFLDNATGAPGPDGIPDTSGAHTINLANLLVARDNNRQAIFDLLYLEKAIAFMDIDGDEAPDFDSNSISFIGHSLGGMVGTGVIAYSDNINTAALANPGGAIASLLNGSETFGPRIRAGVAAGAGITTEDPTFAGTLAQFLFAAQTVVDSSDPANTAAFAVSNNVPTLMLQNLGDAVVPNSVATAPLAGTEPLARVLGLTTVATEEAGLVVGDRLFTKLNVGGHSSVLSPDEATVEMQTQIVSFLSSGGAAVQVVDPTLLDD
ncbi:MAG: hypothetical protein ABJI60_00945 [Kangiellaceae bacterium]